MRVPARCAAAAILAAAAFHGAAEAFAGDSTWQVASGDWSTSAFWNGGVPTVNDDAYIANGGTANVTLSGATCSFLHLGSGSAGRGTVQMTGGDLTLNGGLIQGNGAGSAGSFNLSGGNFQGGSEYIGDSLGTGVFSQSGGTNTGGEDNYLGNSVASSGTYNLSGNGLLFANNEHIGFSGTGSFTQSGGANSLFANLTLGEHFGGSGTYTLNSGSLLDPATETIGKSGTGSFTQWGGTNTISGFSQVLSLAQSTGSSGTYTLNGGVLNLSGLIQGSGNATFNNGGGTFQAGASFPTSVPIVLSTAGGNGVFDSNGYTITLTGSLSGPGGLRKIGPGSVTVTAINTFSGNVTVAADTLVVPSGQLPANNEYVGGSGSAYLSLAGGNNVVTTHLYLGYNSGDSGYYSLTAGSLSAPNEDIGYEGSGTFNQSGGTHAVANSLSVGTYSNGTYNLSGSGLLSAANETIGNAFVGHFIQSGGSNSATSSLTIAFASPFGGNYELDAGRLSTPTEYVGYGRSGTFTQPGGNHLVSSNLYLGYNAPYGNGTYYLSGSGALSAPNEYVGYSGTGTVNQTGGTNTVSANIYLGYAGSGSGGGIGTYNLSGSGSLSNANVYIGYSGLGTFNQTGGTHAVSANLYLGYNAGGAGTYNMTAGLLDPATEYVGYNGAGVFYQTGGTNVATNLSVNNGYYLLGGGVLQLLSGGTVQVNNGGGLQMAGGTVDCGGHAVTILADSCILDITGNIVNTSSTTISGGPNALITVPQGFDPTKYGHVSNLGITHTLGTTLTVSPGMALNCWGTIVDPVVCQGGIFWPPSPIGGYPPTPVGGYPPTPINSYPPNPCQGLNLMGGLQLLTGQVNLGPGELLVPDAQSGMHADTTLTTGLMMVPGAWEQSGGTSSSGTLTLSGRNLNPGIYHMIDGDLIADTLMIGASGSGNMMQDGGHLSAQSIVVALLNGDSGSLTHSGSSTILTQVLQIGAGGAGSVNQMGGQLSAQSIYVAYLNGGSGTLAHSGGTLSEQLLQVGVNGSGTVNQTGGMHTVSMELDHAVNLGSTAMYTLSGADSTLWPMKEQIGVGGAATFMQMGGTHWVDTELDFAVNPSSSAAYELDGGLLSASNEVLAAGGIATFTQTGGTHTVSTMVIARDAGSVGSYYLNGGKLQIASSLYQGLGSGILSLSGSATLEAQGDCFVNVPIVLQNLAFVDTSSNMVTVGQSIVGPGSLVKLGPGILALLNSNSFTGDIIASNGTLTLNDPYSLAYARVHTSFGGILSLGSSIGEFHFGGLTGGGNLMLTDADGVDVHLDVGGNNGDSTYSGNISSYDGMGSLTKVGSGLLVLSGMNTYRGGTTVMEGTLVAANSMALMDGSNLTVGDPMMFPAPVVPSATIAVPEPSAFALLAFGLWSGAIYRLFSARRNSPEALVRQPRTDQTCALQAAHGVK